VDGTRGQRCGSTRDRQLDKLEFRAVWSVAARGKGAVPAELANLLLRENARMIVGAWQVNQGKDDYLVVLSAPVSAAADAGDAARSARGGDVQHGPDREAALRQGRVLAAFHQLGLSTAARIPSRRQRTSGRLRFPWLSPPRVGAGMAPHLYDDQMLGREKGLQPFRFRN